MENWGLIIYRETATNHSPTSNSVDQWLTSTVTHEIIHQVAVLCGSQR